MRTLTDTYPGGENIFFVCVAGQDLVGGTNWWTVLKPQPLPTGEEYDLSPFCFLFVFFVLFHLASLFQFVACSFFVLLRFFCFCFLFVFLFLFGVFLLLFFVSPRTHTIVSHIERAFVTDYQSGVLKH